MSAEFVMSLEESREKMGEMAYSGIARVGARVGGKGTSRSAIVGVQGSIARESHVHLDAYRLEDPVE